MTVLLDAVTSIFSQHGAATTILGQYRPMQQEFAISLAKFCEDRTHDTKVPVYVQEIMAGVGKTHAVGVVLGLDAIIHRRQGILVTYTRALRREYLAQAVIIDKLVGQGLRDIGQSGLYRPLTMGEYKSIMSYISPAKIHTLKTRLANDQIEESPQLLNLIRYCDEQTAHGQPPEFSDFFVSGGSVDGGNGELPPHTSEMDLALCQADKKSPVMKQFRDDNNAAKAADIMVTTHAMLVRNSIARGKILNTDRDIADEDDDDLPKRTGIAVIDEGDKIPSIAYANLKATVSRNVMITFMTEVTTRYHDAEADTASEIASAMETIQKGLELLDTWAKSHFPNRPPVIMQKENPLLMGVFSTAMEHVHAGIKTIRRIAHGDYHVRDRDVIIVDQCDRLIQDVWFVIRKALSASHPMLAVDYSKDTFGTLDIRLTLDLGFGRHLINQLWRPGNRDEPVHTLSGVVMVSATLTDLPPRRSEYQQFLRSIGYDHEVDGDRLVAVEPIRAHPKTRPWGRVENLAIIHRNVALHPTDMTQPDNINRAFLDQAVVAIKAAMDRQLTRPASAKMLILCPSYALVDLLAERVTGARIIKRQSGADLRSAMDQFIEIDHAVWIGVDWEGVNFVDHAGKSLISTLVIARMPVPPPDHLKIERSAGGHEQSGHNPAKATRIATNTAMQESVLIAYRRVVQGLGRAFRNANDVLDECLLLDQRFPVPPRVAAGRKISRSSAVDVTNLFVHFDTVIERHTVGHWWKIEQDGRLTSLS